MACSMLIEPKMSSGGRRAAEKSSCEHTYKMPGLRSPHSGRAVLRPRPRSSLVLRLRISVGACRYLDNLRSTSSGPILVYLRT